MRLHLEKGVGRGEGGGVISLLAIGYQKTRNTDVTANNAFLEQLKTIY